LLTRKASGPLYRSIKPRRVEFLPREPMGRFFRGLCGPPCENPIHRSRAENEPIQPLATTPLRFHPRVPVLGYLSRLRATTAWPSWLELRLRGASKIDPLARHAVPIAIVFAKFTSMRPSRDAPRSFPSKRNFLIAAREHGIEENAALPTLCFRLSAPRRYLRDMNPALSPGSGCQLMPAACCVSGFVIVDSAFDDPAQAAQSPMPLVRRHSPRMPVKISAA